MKYLITIIMGLALTACGGGGGGGGGSSDNDSSTPPPAPPAAVTVPEEETTMQDLVVPEGFNYNPVKEGTLSVDISGFSSQRAHLSLYKEFQEDNSGNYKASYPSKVASIPLNNGQADFDFNMSDSQGDLLVEIWFYDGTDPIQRVISASDTSLTL
ncbi:hypothetical protein [Vibrio hyugaensis]|uniref:Lipoprotein n=1 Tax=Vibrio hyugaensis TaxID=1534743 RepID=A0ABQ5YA35_9VIBR|nr:hypothetical protein [Vibrio hyugaensis]GLR06281.1 hypothetical protein GCM10007906_38690 [Vibrio hyugaensis]